MAAQPVNEPDKPERVSSVGAAEILGLLGVALLAEGGRRIYEPAAWILAGLALITIAYLEARRVARGG